jgi:hypothetical protein
MLDADGLIAQRRSGRAWYCGRANLYPEMQENEA